MKTISISAFTAFLMMVFSCSQNKEQNNAIDNSHVTTDSTQPVNKLDGNNSESHSDVFSGEYAIGEGGSMVYPVDGAYEMRNEKGETQNVLFFQRKENDTVCVYATKSKTITFKMNPGHKTGRYFEDDESWPVTFVKPNPKEETEQQETDRIMKQRHLDDSVAFSELAIYDGTYRIQTESDGVDAKLNLQYKGNQTFAYDWSFNVSAEEAACNGKRKGILTMDRTQSSNPGEFHPQVLTEPYLKLSLHTALQDCLYR